MSGTLPTTHDTVREEVGAQAPVNTEETVKTEPVIVADASLQLDTAQDAAVKLCVDIKKRVVGVTGPAGTGKTTIMKQVAAALIAAGYRVVACAPTGKAARRIHEATGLESMTIHRLLKYPFPGERDAKTGEALRPGFPQHDRFNPLPYDIVLADEYAMVNHEVHTNLVDALPPKGCLRCFGDVNQLPPIETSAALQTESPFQKVLKHFPNVRLETIHRQGEGSGIVLAGVNILKGRGPSRASDFIIKMSDKPIETLTDVVMEGLDAAEPRDFSKLDCQIITPTRKSWIGTAKLNSTLQTLLNPDMKGAIVLPRHSWAIDKNTRVAAGDKVIWTQNNYDLNIFNGETGVVEECTDVGEVIVNWGDRVVCVPPSLSVTRKDGTIAYVDPRRDLDLAYAVTTHKSQGSEFKHVIYILNKSCIFMQDQANYYTAITRARYSVTLICDQQSFFGSLRKPQIKTKKGLDQ